MVRVRRLAAVLQDCFDGEDCATGGPGSRELQLLVELRLMLSVPSWSDKLTLSMMVESNKVAEMFDRPQLVCSQGKSDLAIQENTSSDICTHSTRNHVLHSSHRIHPCIKSVHDLFFSFFFFFFFLHSLQGYLGSLGPRLTSMSPALKMVRRRSIEFIRVILKMKDGVRPLTAALS